MPKDEEDVMETVTAVVIETAMVMGMMVVPTNYPCPSCRLGCTDFACYEDDHH